MSDDHSSDAQLLQLRIVPAEVVVGRSTVGEAVIDGDDSLADVDRVHTQRSRAEHPGYDLPMETLHDIIGQHARHAPPLPSSGMQFEERVGQSINIQRCGRLEHHRSQPLQRSPVVAQLLLKMRGDQILQFIARALDGKHGAAIVIADVVAPAVGRRDLQHRRRRPELLQVPHLAVHARHLGDDGR